MIPVLLRIMLLIRTCLAWSYVVPILVYSINSSFASPTQHILEKREVAPSNLSMEAQDAYEHVISFFRPVTCRHKDEQILIPCHVGEDLNTNECLENKCCPAKTSLELQCYMPFKDNVQLAFRLILLVAGGLFILGCLPFCCACLQRSRCANPLRKANNKVKQIVLKKRAHNEDIYIPLLE
ncbi:FMR1 neighbor protein [Dryobates pubescens]|uniref:FMR1 neighbor protein n=1 Tax=Dryobates pubescens TaxID=118200 RepID=UPI0023B8EC26|nr:FMR1 neighbor protein [Dryobates pubescens]